MEYNYYFRHKPPSMYVAPWKLPAQTYRGLFGDLKTVYEAMLDRWIYWEGLGDDTGVHYCMFDKVYLPYITGFSREKIACLLGVLWERDMICFAMQTPVGDYRRSYEESLAVFSCSQGYHRWRKKQNEDNVYNRRHRVTRKILQSVGWIKPDPPPVNPIPVEPPTPLTVPPIDQDKAAVCGVYLVKSISGHYKIGKSSNIRDRVKTFGILLPFEIELEHFIPTLNYHEAERALHRRFADKRVNGEWFALTPADVATIRSIERL